VIPCGLGYLLPPEGNAEAVAVRWLGRQLCPGLPLTSFNARAGRTRIIKSELSHINL
jgi:hypothetical protein